MGNKKKLLVTGANGLVGSAVRAIAEKYNFDFIFAAREQANLENQLAVSDLFKVTRPDYVLHLASRVGGIGRNLNSQAQQFTSNVLMNTFVIDAAHKYDVERLIAFIPRPLKFFFFGRILNLKYS